MDQKPTEPPRSTTSVGDLKAHITVLKSKLCSTNFYSIQERKATHVLIHKSHTSDVKSQQKFIQTPERVSEVPGPSFLRLLNSSSSSPRCAFSGTAQPSALPRCSSPRGAGGTRRSAEAVSAGKSQVRATFCSWKHFDIEAKTCG